MGSDSKWQPTTANQEHLDKLYLLPLKVQATFSSNVLLLRNKQATVSCIGYVHLSEVIFSE